MTGFPNIPGVLTLALAMLLFALAAPAAAEPALAVDAAAEAWLGAYCPPRASPSWNLASFGAAALFVAWRGRSARARARPQGTAR